MSPAYRNPLAVYRCSKYIGHVARLSQDKGLTFLTVTELSDEKLEDNWGPIERSWDSKNANEIRSKLVLCAKREHLSAYLQRSSRDLVIDPNELNCWDVNPHRCFEPLTKYWAKERMENGRRRIVAQSEGIVQQTFPEEIAARMYEFHSEALKSYLQLTSSEIPLYRS